MPRLSEYNLEDLEQINPTKFQLATGLDTFSFREFENLAEKYELETPGLGYQRAYLDTLTELFRTALLKHLNCESQMPNYAGMTGCYDDFLIKPYILARKEENIPVNIKINGDEFNLETLESFQNVLLQIPDPSPIYDVVEENFKSGEYAKNDMYDWIQRLNNSRRRITRPLARKIAACAAVLEKKNRERNPVLRILIFPVHFIEKYLIKELKALAVKDLIVRDNKKDPAKKELPEEVEEKQRAEEAQKELIYKELVDEASHPDPYFSELQMEISSMVRTMRREAQQILDGPILRQRDFERIDNLEKEIDLENLQGIAPEEFEEFFTDNELDNNKVNDFINQTIDLENGNKLQPDYNESEQDFSLNGSIIEDGSFVADEEDVRFSIEVNELFYDRAALDGAFDRELGAADNFINLSGSKTFIEKMSDEIVALVDKYDVGYLDKKSWAESSVCEMMLNQTERICRLYDESKTANADQEELEQIIKNGVNELYDLAYLSVDGFDVYAKDDNGIGIEERPVVAQKLTDLFIDMVAPIKFNENGLGKFKENYVIKNRDHAIQAMRKYNKDVPADQCIEIVDKAATELHAFENVEFDKALFDNAPTDVEAKNVEIDELTNDKKIAK